MRILLVGEFSRLHNSLKEGLLALGHEVTIVSSGDHFKNFPADFSIAPKTINSNLILNVLNKISIRLFYLNLEEIEKGIRFYHLLPKLKNYDVVQLINSDAIETIPSFEIKLYKKLFSQNYKKFLLICGDDTPIINILLQQKLRYSILTPYFENPKLKNYFHYSLKYVTPKYTKLYQFVKDNSQGLITSDLDYKIPMDLSKTETTFIPNPINIDKIKFVENPIIDKVVIFHGINKLSSIKKGSQYFEKALEQIKLKYSEKVKTVTVTSLPYAEYEKIMNQAHIVLDQVYGFDQGYNALEAMAKGKVVFTGADKEFLEHYNLEEDEVAINALANVDYLVEKLSFLIENPEKITQISKNARTFIEREHDYIAIAKKYLAVWESNPSS